MNAFRVVYIQLTKKKKEKELFVIFSIVNAIEYLPYGIKKTNQLISLVIFFSSLNSYQFNPYICILEPTNNKYICLTKKKRIVVIRNIMIITVHVRKVYIEYIAFTALIHFAIELSIQFKCTLRMFSFESFFLFYYYLATQKGTAQFYIL